MTKYNKTYLIQTALTLLGFKPGLIDGLDGPKTKAAYNEWLNSVSPKEALSKLSNRIVSAAQNEVGVRETSRNQGPGIEKYWSATSYSNGYKNREPYCAAFVCWCVREACLNEIVSFDLPRSALAYDFEKWGRANNNKGVDVLDYSAGVKPGDIFTLAAASHVGIVKSVGDNHITTIEGNTDGSGSREGDGVYQKVRRISSIRKLIRVS